MDPIIDKVITFESEKNSRLDISSIRDQISSISKEVSNGKLTFPDMELNYIPNDNFIGEDFFSFFNKEGELVVVAISIKDSVFRPRARLLIQLGNQLIKNESIALVELVKNSYDADASRCTVTMTNSNNTDFGSIIVQDDGIGMDLDTIKNSWMEPGSDNKAILVREMKLSTKFKRLPIGEKGIGRFGVHKLGNEIELVTRKAGCKEIVVNINWDQFEKYKYLKDAPVQIREREAHVFKGNSTGTLITIKKLTKVWTRGMVRDVYRAVNAISTPGSYDIEKILDLENLDTKNKRHEDIFYSEFKTDQPEWIADIPSWKEIVELAIYYFDIEVRDDKIIKFKYKFRPWDSMKKMNPREINEEDLPIKDLLEIVDPDSRKVLPLEISKNLKIGTFKFTGCIFTRDLPTLKLAGIQPQSFKDYLDENGGIRIYRDGIRVYDYGERENDWLGLDYRRFNDPGVRISNNLILASINLKRKESGDLTEKTNREGFIDNKAYEIFKKQITYALKLVELLRIEDKQKLDTSSKPSEERESVLKSIDDLKSLVKEKIKNKELQKELDLYVGRIEKNYIFMNNTLIKSASAGLGWSVYIHEVEKIIAEILKVLKREQASERLLKLTSHLSGLIESYAQILRKTNRGSEDLKKIIEQALFNVEFRLKAHKITLVSKYKDFSKNSFAKVTRSLVVANIMNIIDNSIYWLDRSKKTEKIILIDIAEVADDYISIVVSDNGKGFALTGEQMIQPFVSAKPGGIGLGLHIVSEVMESSNGSVSFNENGEYPQPKELKGGATLLLNFKK